MPSPTPYNFNTQLTAGQQGEAHLDQFFSRAYAIQPASDAEQRREIDRWFTNLKTGNRFGVEYKTDAAANRTGNAFVETVSVLEREKPGWALMSEAEYLIYYCPAPDTIYVIRFHDLRNRLPMWSAKHPLRDIPNTSYTTQGLLVPLAEFERCAIKVW